MSRISSSLPPLPSLLSFTITTKTTTTSSTTTPHLHLHYLRTDASIDADRAGTFGIALEGADVGSMRDGKEDDAESTGPGAGAGKGKGLGEAAKAVSSMPAPAAPAVATAAAGAAAVREEPAAIEDDDGA